MQRRKQELEELKDQVRKRGKKFVSYKEGADLYSLGLHTFEKLAKDACILRGSPVTDAFSSGRLAEQNGHPKTCR